MSNDSKNYVCKVGFARADITPKKLPILATESRSPYFTRVIDPLYATCIAINDGENTALVITIDLKGTYEYINTNMVDRIMKATGLPKENIMISAIHNHSAPASSDDGNKPKFPWDDGIYEWLDYVFAQMGPLAIAAIDDLSEAEIYTAVEDTTGMAYVRRYLHADGGYSSIQNRVKNTTEIVAHETDADASLQIIKFKREGKKDIVISNWQAHVAHAVGVYPDGITADLVYFVRDAVEKESGVLYAYYAGASGNLNLRGIIFHDGVNKYDNNHEKVGAALGVLINSALSKEMKKVNAGAVKADIVNVSAKTRKDDPERIELAKKVAESGYDRELRKAYGFISSYDVNAVLDRSVLGDTEDVPLGVISFGDIAFVAAPYEMFDTNGMEVKEGSPFKTTFVLSCAGGNYDYMPSKFAFPHEGYEVMRTRYVEGTSEQFVAAFVDTLKKQKGE